VPHWISELIQRHGFGVFVALVLMAELLGFNPYSPLRDVRALAEQIKDHERTTNTQRVVTQSQLEQLIRAMRKQNQLQAITARQACLANAKTAAERDKCAEIDD
jgi:hypothetical protein